MLQTSDSFFGVALNPTASISLYKRIKETEPQRTPHSKFSVGGVPPCRGLSGRGSQPSRWAWPRGAMDPNACYSHSSQGYDLQHLEARHPGTWNWSMSKTRQTLGPCLPSGRSWQAPLELWGDPTPRRRCRRSFYVVLQPKSANNFSFKFISPGCQSPT